MEPSFNDITGVAVDPERGTGTPATIYDNSALSKSLHENAQIKAGNDWKKYNIFLDRLNNVYKDINEIAKQPVLEEDMPALRKEMASIIKDIGSDHKSFFGGGAKYNEINGKIAQLQSKATESKGNNLFDAAHRQFFYRNPDLETPENKALMEGFRKQPLGSRQPYQLEMPGLVDMDALAKTINANVKKEESYSRPTKDNQFIEKGKDVIYDPVKYDELAKIAYDQTDARNVPIRATMEKRFAKLPPYLQEQIKEQYKNEKEPLKAWFVDDLKKRIMANSSTKDDLVPNPGYLEKEKLAQKAAADKADLAVKWANYGLAKDKIDKADAEDLSGADSVINEAISKIKKGEEGSPKTKGWKGMVPVNEFRIADPSTLQFFGKLDKTGNIYEAPAYMEYNKKNNQLNIVFETKNNKGKVTGIEKKPLDEREWVSLIVKRKYPNKDIGGINEIVEDVIKQNGNLYNLSQKFNTGSSDNGSIKKVAGDADISVLGDGDYKISSGKNKGKTVTIKNGAPVEIR